MTRLKEVSSSENERFHCTCMCLKAGSQCDARPCVVLICETKIFLIKNFSNFFAIRHRGRNTKERKDRIRVYSSVALRYDECQREGDAMQHME